MNLVWRRAEPEDVTELRAFTCATADRQRERTLEDWLRTRGAEGWQLPLQPPEFLVLGRDSEGIAAVAYYSHHQAPAHAHVRAIAVSERLRNGDVRYGDEAMGQVLSRIERRGHRLGQGRVVVTGKLEVDNQGSRYLVQRHGFRHCETGDGLETWARVVAA